MKKIKVYLKMVLKFILALISVVGVSVLGNLLKDIIPFRNVLLVIVMVLLIANVVSNFIINIKDLSKIKKKKSGEQLILLLLKTKEEALENPEGVRSRILKKYNNIRFYSYITLFLMYAILFLCPIDYVVPYFLYFLLFTYFYSIFDAKRKMELGNNEVLENCLMDEVEFKELYDIVDKVKSYHNVKKKVKILYSYNSQLSITEDDDSIIIIVGYYILRLLTKEELEASLHHEFAHFINSDTDYSLKFSKLSSSIDSLANSLYFKVLYPNIYSLTFETELLNYLSTIFYERKADDVINKVGCNEAFINGLAKIYIYDLYYKQYLEDTTIGRFSDAPYNILNIGYDDFLRYYNNNKDYIKVFLEKSVVGRFETHPSIVERKESLNVSKIEISFDKNEFKTLADLIEEKFIKDNKENIEKQYSVVREAYVKALSNFDNINEESRQDELIALAFELFKLALYEKAMIVCDKILEINPNQSRACFIKGAILLNLDHNEEGASYLFKLIEENHSEYLTDSIQILGSYYSSIGDEAGIIKLRNMQASAYDNDMNYEELSKLFPKDNLTVVSSDSGINMVLDIVKNTCVEKLVVVRKTLNNKSMIHVIAVFDHYETEDNVYDMTNKIWSVLDAINDIDYYLTPMSLIHFVNMKWLHKYVVYDKE